MGDHKLVGSNQDNASPLRDSYSGFFDDRPDDSDIDGALHHKPSMLKQIGTWFRDVGAQFTAFFVGLGEGIASAWTAVKRAFGSEDQAQQAVRHIQQPITAEERAVLQPREQLANLTQPGLHRIDTEKKQAVATADFIESVDIPFNIPVSQQGEDELAFDAYATLCKQDGKPLGAIPCPQNFNDAAVRYAKAFLGQVAQRKQTAEKTHAEFWLSSTDQEKFEGAKNLLAQQFDKESKQLAEAANKLGKIHKNSSHQCLSFMAWRDWRKEPSKQPAYENFSIEAALAYANELQSQYKNQYLATNHHLQALLSDATLLITQKDHYLDLYAFLQLEKISDDIAKLTTSASNATNAPTDSLVSPAPPPPPNRTKNTVTHATLHKIPDLSTFETEIQTMSYARLNQFFDEYSQQIDKGLVKVDRNDPLFTAMASAAVEFLNKADAAPETVDWQMYAAANFVINEYRLHQDDMGKSSGL
ncbi:MAG: hypothetical protein ACKO5Z_05145 [Burkholderiaceae bacterium]